MGDQLLSLSEASFKRVVAVGAQALPGDWRVTPELFSGSLAAAAAEVALQLAPSQSVPSMHASLGGDSASPAIVQPLDANALEVGNCSPQEALLSKTTMCLYDPRLLAASFVGFSLMFQAYVGLGTGLPSRLPAPTRRSSPFVEAALGAPVADKGDASSAFFSSPICFLCKTWQAVRHTSGKLVNEQQGLSLRAPNI